MGVAAPLRERRALRAAGLVGGPAEVVDLVLPLWAGAAAGLSATGVGLLLAVVAAASLAVRPVARVLADRWERRHTAATGALLYALSCAGYAVAQGAPLAYGAAVVGGAGGAVMWAALRAIVRERQVDDKEALLRVTSARDVGAWVAGVLGLVVLWLLGFAGLFWACAGLCVLAAAVLMAVPRREDGDGPDDGPGDEPGAVGGRVRAFVAVAATTAVDIALWLLLVLHLQHEFGLGVFPVLLVIAPGVMVSGATALHVHRHLRRYGRGRVSAVAALTGCTAALSLAWAPDPYVIAAVWVLTGVMWGTVIPVRQPLVDKAAFSRPLGVQEPSGLVGLLVGSLAAGLLYDSVQWWVACAVVAATILVCTALLWWAARSLGAPVAQA